MIKTFFDACSGIGGGRLGLERAGLECVAYCDTSRLSKITYRLLFDTSNESYFYNVRTLKTDMLPKYDLLIAGFPCQTFSVMGQKKGFNDKRGQIIFHLSRIINETKPKCFLLENVKGLVTHDKGKTIKTIVEELTNCGYRVTYKVLNSIDFGVPQMRNRVYFIGIRNDLCNDINLFCWPNPLAKPPLKDFLQDRHEIDEEREEILKYYLNNDTNKGKYSISDLKHMDNVILDTRMNDLRIYLDKCPTLRSQRDGLLYVYNQKIYQLTGAEALKLQGFSDKHIEKVRNVVSDRHLLMQAGNAMTVNVITLLGESIVKFIENEKKVEEKNYE